MAFEHYVTAGGKRLRRGYTTGTCAALAAAGAAKLLLEGEAPQLLKLMTPAGLPVEVEPRVCRMEGEAALCLVEKDGGDDIDATAGLLIGAQVEKVPGSELSIVGGAGVGRVTKPGLDQGVGEAAINHVPREMILREVDRVRAAAGYAGGLQVTILVPEGAQAAKKTFNPQLGIEGGISILGTSGIVEPMSLSALVDTIALELRQAAALGQRRVILTPGNYGADFLKEHKLGSEMTQVVKCSNFIGEALDFGAEQGFKEILLVGHVGKLVKVAGGIMNTHSRWADCRTELFCAHAAVAGASRELCRRLMEAASADACIALLDQEGLREPVMESLLGAIQTHLDRRAAGAFRTGAVLFSNQYGLLGKTTGAEGILAEWNR